MTHYPPRPTLFRMSFHTWILYAAATLLLTASPGPNALLALSHGRVHGARQTSATVAGSFTGFAMMVVLGLAGAGAVLAASIVWFRALRVVGACYLVFLGIRAWRGAGSPTVSPAVSPTYVRGAWQRYRSGFAVAVSNPKVAVFFAAYVPQFLSPHGDRLLQMLILGLTFLALEASWELIYATTGDRLGRWLSTPSVRRRLDRGTGVLFVAAGGALAVSAARS